MTGVFVFLPIAVNLFLIQHKESKRYLCGRNSRLFGLVSKQLISKKIKFYQFFLFFSQIERNERQCVFETKRSDIDFGRWDSFRLFYENPNRGYLSISYGCRARLRRKFNNDNYLNFLAFIRINTDVSSETAAARSVVHQKQHSYKRRMHNINPARNNLPELISDYRQRFQFPLPISTKTRSATTPSKTTRFRLLQRLPSSPRLVTFKSSIVHVQNPPYELNAPVATRT